MRPYIHENFMLNNKVAVKLYHEVAANLPVIDYHNHLNPADVVANRKYENLAQVWLINDPYKHRAMRIHGIPEKYITGDASDLEKFMKWAETVPCTMGNPLFHWSALELKRIFNIDKMLTLDTAEDIWNTCNEQLQDDSYGASALLNRWKTEIVTTSDDLLDSFEHHRDASELQPGFKMYPSLRGDSILMMEQEGFAGFRKVLTQLTGRETDSFSGFRNAITARLDVLDQMGCFAADHALDNGFYICEPDMSLAEKIFDKMLANKVVSDHEFCAIKSTLIHLLGVEYHDRDWLMLLHIGAERYTNSRLRKIAGPAGGYAGMGDSIKIKDLCIFLDSLDNNGKLPRTVLFNLNPVDNAAFATLTGSYAEDGVAGKVQFGPAWWYNDHKHGMEQQLINLANHGLLYHFIGMTTDSRSVLSFSRHEYFRRIFCNLIGTWVESGDLPNDEKWLADLVKRACYLNAKEVIDKRKG